VPSPWLLTAATTMPRANTNRQNSGAAAPSSVRGVAASRVSASTLNANVGVRGPGRSAGVGRGSGAARVSSARKNQRNTRYSTAMAQSQGSVMSAAKPVNDRPDAAKASRLVRLDTGSSCEAEFARCVQA
jgi:hypothetical protein